jgi:hypothetical protein
MYDQTPGLMSVFPVTVILKRAFGGVFPGETPIDARSALYLEENAVNA